MPDKMNLDDLKLLYRVCQKYKAPCVQLVVSQKIAQISVIKQQNAPLCGFTAQLVEHRTGITEVTGSNPVEALIFFRLLPSNCLNLKIYCDDHSSLSEHIEHTFLISDYH